MMTGTTDGAIKQGHSRSTNTLPATFSLHDAHSFQVTARDRSAVNTQRTLMALEHTRIKYPGKTDGEANQVLDGVSGCLRQ